MTWTYLAAAAMFEVVWALGLEYTDGFTELWPSVGTALAMAASLVLLAKAVETLPIGTAYAVWTGVGAVGAVLGGIVLFGEPRGALRLAFVGLVVFGVAGLRLTAGA